MQLTERGVQRLVELVRQQSATLGYVLDTPALAGREGDTGAAQGNGTAAAPLYPHPLPSVSRDFLYH